MLQKYLGSRWDAQEKEWKAVAQSERRWLSETKYWSGMKAPKVWLLVYDNAGMPWDPTRLKYRKGSVTMPFATRS